MRSVEPQVVLSRTADLIEDCGWAPGGEGVSRPQRPPYNLYRAIEAAALLLRQEMPEVDLPSAEDAQKAMRARLGRILYAWEDGKTQAEVVAALRGAVSAAAPSGGRIREIRERLAEDADWLAGWDRGDFSPYPWPPPAEFFGLIESARLAGLIESARLAVADRAYLLSLNSRSATAMALDEVRGERDRLAMLLAGAETEIRALEAEIRALGHALRAADCRTGDPAEPVYAWEALGNG